MEKIAKPVCAREAAENAMLPLIAERRSEIADISRRFGVRRLAVFGSATRGQDFDPERSDVDFLVAFERGHGAIQENLPALRARVAAPVGRDGRGMSLFAEPVVEDTPEAALAGMPRRDHAWRAPARNAASRSKPTSAFRLAMSR